MEDSRDLMDLLNGETIIYDQNGNRVSIEDLPEDIKVVSVRDFGFEVIKRDFYNGRERRRDSD